MPVFCFEDRLLSGRHASGPRTQFLLDCLAELDAALAERGGGLVVRRGPAEHELAQLAGEVGADEVHFSADVGPFARRRVEAVSLALRAQASRRWSTRALRRWTTSPQLRTQAGRPYTVFSPFHRRWLEAPRREPLGAPRSLPPLPSGAQRRADCRRSARSVSSRSSRSRRTEARRGRASGCRASSAGT